jgi:hypothetical protein
VCATKKTKNTNNLWDKRTSRRKVNLTCTHRARSGAEGQGTLSTRSACDFAHSAQRDFPRQRIFEMRVVTKEPSDAELGKLYRLKQAEVIRQFREWVESELASRATTGRDPGEFGKMGGGQILKTRSSRENRRAKSLRRLIIIINRRHSPPRCAA